MTDGVVIALIGGVFSIVCSIITGLITSSKAIANMDKAQAVMNTQITELTREVREHNNFARRMPVVEEQIKVINNRLADLERGN